MRSAAVSSTFSSIVPFFTASTSCLSFAGVLAGHFEIHAGLEALDAVRRRRAPVADDIAVKAPFVAEDVGQQPLVLRLHTCR